MSGFVTNINIDISAYITPKLIWVVMGKTGIRKSK